MDRTEIFRQLRRRRVEDFIQRLQSVVAHRIWLLHKGRIDGSCFDPVQRIRVRVPCNQHAVGRIAALNRIRNRLAARRLQADKRINLFGPVNAINSCALSNATLASLLVSTTSTILISGRAAKASLKPLSRSSMFGWPAKREEDHIAFSAKFFDQAPSTHSPASRLFVPMKKSLSAACRIRIDRDHGNSRLHRRVDLRLKDRVVGHRDQNSRRLRSHGFLQLREFSLRIVVRPGQQPWPSL